MTQQDQSEHTSSGSEQARPIGGFSRAIADILVHRPVLTHLIATILPDAEKARLRALVGADLDRARFLGSSPSEAGQMRDHAHDVLDKMMTAQLEGPAPGDRH
jgi:hypothetical protein